jgi:transposase-like protein
MSVRALLFSSALSFRDVELMMAERGVIFFKSFLSQNNQYTTR